MTTSSINRPGAARPQRSSRRAGFTLGEVLIAAGLAAFILTGILTSFVMIGRSGAMLSNYVRLEQEARRGLERFGEDVRMGSAIATTSSWPYEVTLTVPHISDNNANTVTYSWDQTTGSTTYHCLMRRELDQAGALVSQEKLVANINTFQFDRWTAGGASGVQASGDATTDQLQIHLTITLQGNEFGVTSSAVAAATNLVVSARYILRNKH